MKSAEILAILSEIRESIIWNAVADIDFSDDNRESIVIALDDIIDKIKDPQSEE